MTELSVLRASSTTRVYSVEMTVDAASRSMAPSTLSTCELVRTPACISVCGYLSVLLNV